jgi:hypothetical protein
MRYAASRSAEEISEMLGGVITPERVQEQGKKLVSDRNWLKMAEREMLLIYQFEEIIADLERVRASGNYEYLGAHLRALKDLGGRLDKLRAATQIDLNALYDNQAQLMLKALDIATSYLRGAFRDKIDQQEWDEAIREGMVLAAAELAKHEAIEQ